MKNVKLNGYTTAELLIELANEYEAVIGSPFMAMAFKGEYNSETPYEYGNIVNDQGSSFVFINKTTAQGIPTTNTEYWYLLASKGADGKDGVGLSHITMGTPYVSGQQTITPLNFEYQDGSHQDLAAYAQNGANGTDGSDGNSVVSFHTVKHVVSGSETVTTVEAVMEEGAGSQFEVHAQNGNGKTLYKHKINITLGGQSFYIIALSTRASEYDYGTLSSDITVTNVVLVGSIFPSTPVLPNILPLSFNNDMLGEYIQTAHFNTSGMGVSNDSFTVHSDEVIAL